MEINDILLEWSYRLKKGYPTMEDGKFTDPNELKVLHEILKENGINEMPSFVKSKTPVSDVLREEAEIPAGPKKTEATEQDIKDIIQKALEAVGDNQPKTLGKLYNRIAAFGVYVPLKQALAKGGFKSKEGGFDMPKKVANELQKVIEDLPASMYDDFVDYISDYDNRKEFPMDKPIGNFATLLAGTNVADEMTLAIGQYAGQDEGRKGVGMGEIMMALCFKNIKKPAGKGDLEIEGLEFEIKAGSARLGSAGGPYISEDPEVLRALAKAKCEARGAKITYKGKSDTASVSLAKSAQDGNQEEVKEALIVMMRAAKLPVDTKSVQAVINRVGDWSSVQTLTTVWGLANLQRYRDIENFGAFLACDLGAGAKGNKGDYVFAYGENMLVDLYEANCTFEKFNLQSNTWPRVEYRK